MVAPDGKDELNRAGLLHHKQDRKDLECDLVWQLLAVSRVRPSATDRKDVEVLGWYLSAGLEWNTAPQAKPAHSGHPAVAGYVAPVSSFKLTRAGRLHHNQITVPQWQACPEWDEVSSELSCRTNLTMRLDSTFLGVHLDSMSWAVKWLGQRKCCDVDDDGVGSLTHIIFYYYSIPSTLDRNFIIFNQLLILLRN